MVEVIQEYFNLVLNSDIFSRVNDLNQEVRNLSQNQTELKSQYDERLNHYANEYDFLKGFVHYFKETLLIAVLR